MGLCASNPGKMSVSNAPNQRDRQPQGSAQLQNGHHNSNEPVAASKTASNPDVPPRPLTLPQHVAQLLQFPVEGGTCCCDTVNGTVDLVKDGVKHMGNGDSNAIKRDVYMLGKAVIKILMGGKECCQYSVAGLLASLTANQFERSLLQQLDFFPALARALSRAAVQNSRPIAVAVGNLSLDQQAHGLVLRAQGLLEGLAGILIWKPTAKQSRYIPADVVEDCKQDAVYALVTISASKKGSATLLQFNGIVPAALQLTATSSSPEAVHMALHLLHRLLRAGGESGRTQVVTAAGIPVLSHLLVNGGHPDAKPGGKSKNRGGEDEDEDDDEVPRVKNLAKQNAQAQWAGGSDADGPTCLRCARGAANVLSELTQNDLDKMEMVEAGIVPPLVSYLQHGDERLRRTSALILSDMALHEECRPHLEDHYDLLPALQMLLKSEANEDTVVAALAISTSLATQQEMQERMMEGGMLLPAVRLLQHGSLRLQAAAACLLAHLALHDGVPKAIAGAGALLPLVRNLEQGGMEGAQAMGWSCRGAALHCLKNVAADPVCAHRISRIDGVVDATMHLVGHPKAHLTSLALALLACLADSASNLAPFVRARGFSQLLPCLEHQDPECREHALYVVAALLADEDAKRRFLAGNVVQILGRRLKDETSLDRQIDYLEVLGALVTTPGNETASTHMSTGQQQQQREVGRQLSAVQGLVFKCMHLLEQLLEIPEGALPHVHLLLEVLRCMDTNLRAAQAAAACPQLPLLGTLLGNSFEDAIRFASIKLVMAIARHKDPMVSHALVDSDIIRALMDVMRVEHKRMVQSPLSQVSRSRLSYLSNLSEYKAAARAAEDGKKEEQDNNGTFSLQVPDLSRSAATQDLLRNGSMANGNGHSKPPFPRLDLTQDSLPDGSMLEPDEEPELERDQNDAMSHRTDETDSAAFWQHCALVALYNMCLDDDVCQEAFMREDGGTLLMDCLDQQTEGSLLCVANFVAALAVDHEANQRSLRDLGMVESLCKVFRQSDDHSIKNVIAVALWELFDHKVPAELPFNVDKQVLLRHKDEVMEQAA